MQILAADFIPSYFHLWQIPVVFLAGLAGEAYGTVVGGGGILMQFALAAFGLPLSSVVATDVAATIGTNLGIMSASPKKIRSNKKLLLMLGVPQFIGGVIGTYLLININLTSLKYILITGMVLLLLRMMTDKGTATYPAHSLSVKLRQYPLIAAVMAVLGIYSNVSAVGSGTFHKLAFVSLLRLSFKDSLGISSIIVLPATLFLFITAAWAGLIVWPYLIPLWLGTFISGRYATKHIRKIQDAHLRKLLVVIVLLYLAYLLWR